MSSFSETKPSPSSDPSSTGEPSSTDRYQATREAIVACFDRLRDAGLVNYGIEELYIKPSVSTDTKRRITFSANVGLAGEEGDVWSIGMTIRSTSTVDSPKPTVHVRWLRYPTAFDNLGIEAGSEDFMYQRMQQRVNVTELPPLEFASWVRTHLRRNAVAPLCEDMKERIEECASRELYGDISRFTLVR